MMKFLFYILFIMFMLLMNNFLMFYYNLLYICSSMMLMMMMFKDNIWYGISISYGFNMYSFMLVVLMFWIIGLMLMSLENFNINKILSFMLLSLILYLFFMSLDLMMFYLFFEISMLPMFFMIVYWGENKDRLSSAYYLIMYMMFISLPFLFYIFNMYYFMLTMKFNLMNLYVYLYKLSLWGFLMTYMAFFIKLPIYFLHLWLPKAHVEAPVYGSMILAGVLLKMGGYGVIQLMLLLYSLIMSFNYMIYLISIIGSFLVSILCLVQIDLKMLVAYSSVVHMNLMLASVMIGSKLGIMSSYIIMISHGLCSSGLFYMVNMFYKRSLSRLMILNKGVLTIFPFLSFWWFIFCVMNFSYPFSLNFIGEIMVLMNIMNWDFYSIIYLVMICFFGAAYSLFLYAYIQHGGMFFYSKYMINLMILEYMILIIHFFPLLLMMLNLNIYV